MKKAKLRDFKKGDIGVSYRFCPAQTCMSVISSSITLRNSIKLCLDESSAELIFTV